MLNMLYESHLSGSDRELEVMMAEHDLTMMRLNTLLEAVDSTLKVNRAAAEVKVLTESGTYNDLVMLYEEADNDATNAKANIFQKIAQAIGNLINKVRDFISNKIMKKAKEQPDEVLQEEVEIPKGLPKILDNLKNVVDSIKGNISNLMAGAVNGYMTLDNILRGKLSEILSNKIFDNAGGVVKVSRDKCLGWLGLLEGKILPVLGGIGALTGTAAAKLIGAKKDNKSSDASSKEGEANTSADSDANNVSDNNPAKETLNIANALSKAVSKISKFLAARALAKTLNEEEPNAAPNDKAVSDDKSNIGTPNHDGTTGAAENQEQAPEDNQPQSNTDQTTQKPGSSKQRPMSAKKKARRKQAAKREKQKQHANGSVNESVDDLLDLFGLSEDDLDMFNENTDDDLDMFGLTSDDLEMFNENTDDGDALDELMSSIEDL